MMETANLAEIANLISEDIFRFFKWEVIPLKDQNFPCINSHKHKPLDKEQAHTHPVDVVFTYIDPYTGRRIYLNTDLKSYAKASINKDGVQKALKSLAQTIECARNSKEWKDNYQLYPEQAEIRGMLFVYNHDNEFDKEFKKFFVDDRKNKNSKSGKSPISIKSLEISKNQYLHIMEPNIIRDLLTIQTDIDFLVGKFLINKKRCYFFYPQLGLHRVKLAREECCATVEVLCSDYLILEHDSVLSDDGKECCPKGYLIYYRGKGGSYEDFIYLLDTLATYQILLDKGSIRIRCVNPDLDSNYQSFFSKAMTTYINQWGFTDGITKQLSLINPERVRKVVTTLSDKEVAWERKNNDEKI